MIVTEFEIDHFRGRNSLRLLDLGNGLNVAVVGNRVDKAAMLSVIPYVLYGTVPNDARKWAAPSTGPQRSENSAEDERLSNRRRELHREPLEEIREGVATLEGGLHKRIVELPHGADANTAEAAR